MIDDLKKLMTDAGIDWFIVFTQDPHLSEYTAGSDKFREALSGFTGSAGTLLVGNSEAYLWTDSRYHIQAERQLTGSGITLMRSGLPGVPQLYDFLREHLWEGQVLAFDQTTVSYNDYKKIRGCLPPSVEITDGGGILKKSVDFPKREFHEIHAVPQKHAGRSIKDKLDEVRKLIRKYHEPDESYTYLISDTASVMWLFNLRGSDITHVPVAYSYAAVTDFSATIYVSRRNLSEEALSELEDAGVNIREYSCFYPDLEDIASDTVIADISRNNSRILAGFDAAGVLKPCSDAHMIRKSVKNTEEIRGMRQAHLKDAVTMIRFIKRLKEMASEDMLGDEYSIGLMLDEMRLNNGCSSLSFDTICAYAENGAIVHYSASKESAKKVSPKGFLLVDSGGQYSFEGTTDITRTICLGNITSEEKKVYTTVLKGNLRLMDAYFPGGYKGVLLDVLAESVLWDEGYNCGHGIGHGVGCNLSVHESDARISRVSQEWEAPLVPGVILSNEPGVYIEGKFGVRLENLLLVTNAQSIDGNKMCRFEPLSLVPFDKEAIDTKLLSDRERNILKKYNELVWEKVSPLLNENEKEWLKVTIDIN